jgi:hypothetical protein
MKLDYKKEASLIEPKEDYLMKFKVSNSALDLFFSRIIS